MFATTADLETASGEITRVARRGLQLARQTEAGQAQTPLTEAFVRLVEAPAAEAVTAVLVGLDSQSTSIALSHLLGQDYHVCRVVVPSRVGYTEVTLQERGFSVERGSQRRDFDDLAAFLAASQAEDLVQPGNPRSWMDPLRLKLASDTHRRGLRLLVPDGLRGLREIPALLSSLADQADWLFVAGPVDAEIPTTELTLLRTLRDRVPGCQPIAVENPAAPAATAHWAAAIGSELPLMRVSAESGAVAPPPRGWLDQLTSPSSGLRRALVETRRRIQVENVLQLLGEEFTRQAGSLRTKRRLLASGLVSRPDDDQRLRAASDDGRTRLQDDIEALRRKLEENARLVLLKDGPAYVKLKAVADAVTTKNLIQHVHDGIIRLSLDDALLEKLRATIMEIGRDRLEEDLRLVHETLENTTEVLGGQLESASSSKCRLQLDFPDHRRLWEGIVALARPEVRYRGELPEITLMHRINEARQPLMLVMMSVMLFGGVVGMLWGQKGKETLQTIAGFTLLPIFVWGIAWTFVNFKRERRHLLDKELLRLQDELFQELRRVVSDIFREEHSLLNQFFQQASRGVGQQITTHIQQLEQQRRRADESHRQHSADQSRVIEERVRSLESQSTECQQLTRDLERVGDDIRRQIKDSIRELSAAVPAPCTDVAMAAVASPRATAPGSVADLTLPPFPGSTPSP